VLDVGFFPDNRVVFAGRRRAAPGLFVAGAGVATPVPLGVSAVSDHPARYPAVSPDGRWLAYAERERGNWQLWLLALDGGERRRLTSADCNTISPAWRADSKRLIYASDCGRGVGLTTLAELQAVP
jgi:dipeptidyl aminopeptidase/acylaminoacyl peptidase